jgi:hypothetical protein
MIRIVLCPGLSHFFVSQKVLLGTPKMPIIPRARGRQSLQLMVVVLSRLQSCIFVPNFLSSLTVFQKNNAFYSGILLAQDTCPGN